MAKLADAERGKWGESVAGGGAGGNSPAAPKTIRGIAYDQASTSELDRGFGREDIRAITIHCSRILAGK